MVYQLEKNEGGQYNLHPGDMERYSAFFNEDKEINEIGQMLLYLDTSQKVIKELHGDIGYLQSKNIPEEKNKEVEQHLDLYKGVLSFLQKDAIPLMSHYKERIETEAYKQSGDITEKEKSAIESLYTDIFSSEKNVPIPTVEELFAQGSNGGYDRKHTETKLLELNDLYFRAIGQTLPGIYANLDQLYRKVEEKPTAAHEKLVAGAAPETEIIEKSALDNPYSNPVSRGLEKGVGYTWDTVKAPLRPFGRDARNGVQAVANSYKTPDIKEAKHLSDWMYQQGKGPSQYQKGIVEGKNELQAAINESDRIVAQGENLGTIIGSAMGFNL